MNSPKSVPLTKDEALLLAQLVGADKIITSKATNASNNLLKQEAWCKITNQFNASVSSCPRKPAQLRLKWENMKKAARKRSAFIRTNKYKTGGGKPDYIKLDEALDQVSSILGATCQGYSVLFRGDADTNLPLARPVCLPFLNGSGDGIDDGVADDCVPGEVIIFETTTATPKSKFLFGASSKRTERNQQVKRKLADDLVASSIQRNKDVSEYYQLKKELMLKQKTVETENIILQNEKLKLEIEVLRNKQI